MALFTFRLLPLVCTASIAIYVLSRFMHFETKSTGALTYSITFIIYLLYWLYIYPYHLSPLRHVPTVPGCPLWGHVFEIFNAEIGAVQQKWHKTHGPIVRYFYPFGKEILSVVDNSALKHILVEASYNYEKTASNRKFLSRLFGEGILTAGGKVHAQQRKALNPAFSISAIKALAPAFWDYSCSMSSYWEQDIKESSDDSVSLDISDWASRATLDIIVAVGFGAKIDTLHNSTAPLIEAFRTVFRFDAVAKLLAVLHILFPIVRYLPIKENREVDAAKRTLFEFASGLIQEKEANIYSTGNNILSQLVRGDRKLQAAGEDIFSRVICDQIATFLGVGQDTSATWLSWTLHLLSKHKHMQVKLREEIRSHFPFLFRSATHEKIDFTEVDVDRLPYLNNVCRESLRFIPPIPIVTREAASDERLGEYFIPKGTVIHIPINTIHRMPEYWGPNSNAFDPDRWNCLPASYTNNAFLPFSHGPRGCIGRKFADTEVKTILCCLLSKFQFSPDPAVQDPEELKRYRIVQKSQYGIRLKVSKLDG
ncbi:cytochrome P450 [Aspergillus flavus]|nr:cytochrome P450 [Aspergillus flavus]